MNASIIKRMPTPDRPRERMQVSGPAALSESELVALLFGGDLECAQALIGRLGGAVGLSRAVLGELRAVPGVGPARAAQLQAAFELATRAAIAERRMDRPISGPEHAIEHLRDLLRLEQEELHVLALDARHRVQLRFMAAQGSMNVVHIQPRDMFRRLLREGAAAAIVAHNHPSGDPEPSDDDVQLTSRLREAGKILGLPVIDHLVVASDGYFSFTDGRATRGRALPVLPLMSDSDEDVA